MVIQAALQQSFADPQMRFEASDHGEVVLAGLTKLREMKQLFDVVFIIENERLSAHRVVLASCSDYFRAMFTDGLLECRLNEIPMNGVTAVGMRSLIDFAYSSKIDINAENVEDVLCAANHIQLTPVIDACVNFMKSHIVHSNCVDVLSVAELFTLHDFALFVYKYISKHLSILASGGEFHKLSESQLKKLLQLNYPVDCTESEVLSAVIGWIVQHHGHSSSHALMYLSQINFSSISLKDIESLQNVSDLNKMLDNEANEGGLKSFISTISRCPKTVPGLINMRGFKECIVVCGGFRPEVGMNNKIHCYDYESGKMQYLTCVPHVEQCNFGMNVMKNELYIIGGCYNNTHMEEIIHSYGFCFSASTQTWRTIPPMLTERCRFYLGCVRNKLYAIGGDPGASQETADYALCECYDVDEKEWKPISPLPGNRMEHAGTTIDGDVYISGGLQDLDGPVFNSFFKYDTQTDMWLQLPSMLSARADHGMFSYGGKIYVIGGWYEDDMTHDRIMVSNVDCFDFKDGCWKTVAQLHSPRLYAAYALNGSKIVMTGGWLNGDCQKKCSTVEVFDINCLSWDVRSDTTSSTESPTQEIWEHASCGIHVPEHVLKESEISEK